MYLLAISTLILSAFFSGVEIAYISSNKLQLEVDKKTGRFPSNILTFLSKNESSFIATMLIGNNIALVIYGIVMTQILTPLLIIYFDTTFGLLLIQTVITTLIVLVAAEFLPKSIFRLYPNQILKIFSIPIWLFFVLLRPISILILELSNLILKYVLNQKRKQIKQVFGRTDLDEYLSNLKPSNNEEDKRVEVEMLQNALDLSEKKLRDCMIPRTEIVATSINSSIQELKDLFIKTKLSKILIFKDNIDNIIGYVHSSDLFKSPKNIRSILLPINFYPESMSAMELLNHFIEINKGVALVVDEFGGTSGMVTIEDVTEEIVGEIIDEHDPEEVMDSKLSNNTYKFLARLDVEMVNKKYNLTLPESEEYQTIAGLILHYHENIPSKDDELYIDQFLFKITQVNKNVIYEVQLKVCSV